MLVGELPIEADKEDGEEEGRGGRATLYGRSTVPGPTYAVQVASAAGAARA
jgi:hypothetical protein